MTNVSLLSSHFTWKRNIKMIPRFYRPERWENSVGNQLENKWHKLEEKLLGCFAYDHVRVWYSHFMLSRSFTSIWDSKITQNLYYFFSLLSHSTGKIHWYKKILSRLNEVLGGCSHESSFLVAFSLNRRIDIISLREAGWDFFRRIFSRRIFYETFNEFDKLELKLPSSAICDHIKAWSQILCLGEVLHLLEFQRQQKVFVFFICIKVKEELFNIITKLNNYRIIIIV